MVKITYVEANGDQKTVDAVPGQSLMKAATSNAVPGILADCGGVAACGTCRIYVDDAAYREKLPPRSALEDAMIDFHGDAEPHVRLACQIPVIESFDGMVLRMPENQHSE